MALTKAQLAKVLKAVRRRYFQEENKKGLPIEITLQPLPTSKKEMATFKTWLDQEQKRFQEDEEHIWPAMGTTTQQMEMKAYWRTNRPKMYKKMLTENLLNKLAHVLECKMWEQEQKNQDAGIPWPDSRNQAQQDWLLMEPEEEM